ncbi:MAG: FN3 associated domain-containing protein, partial [Ignavibacteriaceae bacterium]
TVDEMRKQMMQQWNNITWMPTENWPNGDFSGQMIGKGIGWEIEYAREEKDWEWINQILYMLEVIQRNESIYMENSFLTTGSNHSIEYLNQKELKRMYNGVWKIVDPGNGEQAAWWCWAIAKLRKELGLSAIPEKLCPTPEIKISNQSKFTADIEITSSPGTLIYYSFDGSEPSNNSIRYSHPVSVAKPAIIKAVAYGKNNVVSNVKSMSVTSVFNGLEFSYYRDIKADKNFNWIHLTPSNTGYTKVFDFKSLMLNKNEYGLIFKGYLKINREGNYRFFIITLNHSRLYIDNQLISFDAGSLSDKNKIKELYLNQGFHKLRLESEFNEGKHNIEIYFSRNNQPREIIDSTMLVVKDPNDKVILPPRILPFKPEFDIDEPVSVSITSIDSAKIYYTLNGGNPDKNSFRYKNPFEINSTTTLKAVAINDKQISPVSIMNYKRTEKTKITLKFAPNPKYSALGPASLIDGIHGTVNSGDGNWLGFEGDDFDATLDIRKIKTINEIKTGFLNNPGSWIFLPEEIEYFISNDGKNFKEVFSAIPDTLLQHNKISEIKEYDIKLNNEKARFIRVFAKNIGVCPPWHPGAGNKSWIFVDEITVK